MKSQPAIYALVVLISLVGTSSTVHGATSQDMRKSILATSDTFAFISEKIKPGVVYIDVKKKADATKKTTPTELFLNDPDLKNFFGSDGSKQPPKPPAAPTYSRGSGFIISTVGYILTNAHVIENADTVTVTLENRKSFKATIVGSDSRSDIGVIKIKANEAELSPLKLGSSTDLRTGEWVLAFGSPYEHVQTVTAGIISATGRNSIGISDYEDFIQTDAAINPGNSGGPLVNIHGEVIGISTAYITQTGGYMGLGFAIPIDMARTIVEQLMKNGRVIRGWLGVALKDAAPRYLEKHNLPANKRAARIVGVTEDSPAATAGLHKEDLIISIDKTAINSAADLKNRIALSGPGRTVTLEFYRDGSLRTVNINLAQLK